MSKARTTMHKVEGSSAHHAYLHCRLPDRHRRQQVHQKQQQRGQRDPQERPRYWRKVDLQHPGEQQLQQERLQPVASEHFSAKSLLNLRKTAASVLTPYSARQVEEVYSAAMED